tara:strand:+ start:541 stop:1419 length:879 start_codon:yes stop_codon:yes gene_type:complete
MISSEKISPAKINLYLEIKGRRVDGYHNIESLMTFCKCGDVLKVEKSRSFKLSVKGPYAKLLEKQENLIESSLKKLEIFFNQKFKVNVLLTKNLPISSGMAGGSSNVATFIRCLKEIYDLKDLEGFNDLLLSIGSDVPFCYHGKTAIVESIGENLSFVENFKNYFILLVNPNVEISTREVFENLNVKYISKKQTIFKSSHPKIDIDFIKKRDNVLQNFTVEKNKLIKDLLSFLSSCHGSLLTRMTGSGATCYSLFANKKDLENAKKITVKTFKNYWIQDSTLVNSVEDIKLV